MFNHIFDDDISNLVAVGGTSFSLEQTKKAVAIKFTTVWNANIPEHHDDDE